MTKGVAKFYKVSSDEFIKSFQETFSLREGIAAGETRGAGKTDDGTTRGTGETDDGTTRGTGETDDGITISKIYDDIILPKRATKFSAGYDFFSPIDFILKKGETIKMPTGIRCKMDEDIVLMIFPRSSLGFKYRMMLENTVGIIDSDYFDSKNEGHIFIKFTNHGDKDLIVKKGDAFSQGIFINYFKTIDDDAISLRTGGIGSTSDKK